MKFLRKLKKLFSRISIFNIYILVYKSFKNKTARNSIKKKMKQYRFFPQENNRCLASHLQSILDARGFSVLSQDEISRQFQESEEGVYLDEKSLNHFLAQYHLRCKFFRPSEQLVEPDIFIKDFPDSADVLVFYDYARFHNIRQNARHSSILVDFREGQEKEVYLHDNLTQKVENVSLPDLINSMKTFRNCGFYLIN